MFYRNFLSLNVCFFFVYLNFLTNEAISFHFSHSPRGDPSLERNMHVITHPSPLFHPLPFFPAKKGLFNSKIICDCLKWCGSRQTLRMWTLWPKACWRIWSWCQRGSLQNNMLFTYLSVNMSYWHITWMNTSPGLKVGNLECYMQSLVK